MVFRLTSCNECMMNDVHERDCYSIFDRNAQQNRAVSLGEVKDALHTSCSVQPFFTTRLNDVFLMCIYQTDLDLYSMYAKDIYKTMSVERVRYLVNTRVLSPVCDELVTCYLRTNLEFHRGCWCFINYI
jgi:hypothetical protein